MPNHAWIFLELVSDMFRFLDELQEKCRTLRVVITARAKENEGLPNQIQLVPVKAAAGYLAGRSLLDELNVYATDARTRQLQGF